MLDLGYPLVRPLMFRMDAEKAHERMMALLGAAPGLLGAIASLTMGPPPPALARDAFGVRLAGPVGLAAGMDKDGAAIRFWPSLGFGFLEVGTVTALPQPGNPRPRLFRLIEERAILNRMGFNNLGSEEMTRRLGSLRERGQWPAVPVGVNVGKSKATCLEEAPGDYGLSVRRLAGIADFFTVNVSSPNTPGLRTLQDREPLSRILDAVLENSRGTPILVKLSPDLGDDGIDDAVELAVERGIRGLVATNTTTGRDLLARDPGQDGGLSGRPLWHLSRRRIVRVLDAAAGRIPVVGVGGIDSAERATELLKLGCVAVQVYTGLVFEGPGLPSRLNRGIAAGTYSSPPRDPAGAGPPAPRSGPNAPERPS